MLQFCLTQVHAESEFSVMAVCTLRTWSFRGDAQLGCASENSSGRVSTFLLGVADRNTVPSVRNLNTITLAMKIQLTSFSPHLTMLLSSRRFDKEHTSSLCLDSEPVKKLDQQERKKRTQNLTFIIILQNLA